MWRAWWREGSPRSRPAGGPASSAAPAPSPAKPLIAAYCGLMRRIAAYREARSERAAVFLRVIAALGLLRCIAAYYSTRLIAVYCGLLRHSEGSAQSRAPRLRRAAYCGLLRALRALRLVAAYCGGPERSRRRRGHSELVPQYSGSLRLIAA